MAHTLTWDWRVRTATHSLLRAFLISIVVHFLILSTVEVGYRYDLWRFSPLALLAKWLQPELKAQPLKPTPPRERERTVEEVPVQFVDVDPAQASDEVPPDTKYYSAVSSVAANPDTTKDTARPKLEGKQDVVLKTKDSDRAKPAQPPPKAPVVAKPLETGKDLKPTRLKDIAKIGPPPEQTPKPQTEARPELKPGDLAMAKPGPEQKPVPQPLAPSVPEVTEKPARERPRTVAAALAMNDLNPNSALIGQKMAQEGGIKRFKVESSLAVRGSPLGNYDARFVAAVQECWYALLEQQRYSLDRLGKVVLDFRLTEDGRITSMSVVEENVGDIWTTICQLAITKPSPYEKWPPDVRRMVGADYRDVRFTFYY